MKNFISRAEAMEKEGHKKSCRLAKENKADTINYGVLPLVTREHVCNCKDSSYEDHDSEYEVDIYLLKGEYVAVDAFDRQ